MPDQVAECGLCGLIQDPGPEEPGVDAVCPRCGHVVRARKPDSLVRTRALALAGAIVYVPANYFPLVVVDYHGMLRTATIWTSVRTLFENGQYLVGGLVFTTSLLSPVLKLSSLLLLVLLAGTGRFKKARLRAYQLIELVNPWQMLEVFMVALVVGIVKFRHAAQVTPGAGCWFFGALVMLTLLAAQAFDPRLVYDEEAR